MTHSDATSLGSSVDDALTRRRRRDLGIWRDEPVWIENLGPDGANVLVRRRSGRVEPVSDTPPPIGSNLYSYGAPGWAALSDECLVVLRSDTLGYVSVDSRGVWEPTRSLGDGVAAGYLRRVDARRFVVVVDEGPGRGRRFDLRHVEGSADVVWRTSSLVSDLVVDDSGERWAWLEWPVGTMPWDEARLWRGDLVGGTLVAEEVPGDGAVAQPSWVGDSLWITREGREWSAPWRHDGTSWHAIAVPVGEFRPDWCFGRSWRAPTARGVVCGYVVQSRARVGIVSSDDEFRDIDGSPEYLYELCASGDLVYALASSTRSTSDLWHFDATEEIWKCLDEPTGSVRLSGVVEFRRTTLGTPYLWTPPAPASDAVSPGLVALVHGGPTAYSSYEFSWLKELYCRAGLAVACVDYRGSSSYGRTYRRALDGHWGEFDVADVVDVIHELVERAEVDPSRVFVRGSSAGAMTALLVSRDPLVRGVVAVSAVCDVATLAEHATTLEIESGYVAQLMGDRGSTNAPRRRISPLDEAAALCERVLLIHGTDDDVVPITQARDLAQRLEALGRDVELVELVGERHSIRRTSSNRTALTAELAFYAR